ncbi:hypothetical protein CPB84DRAFT_197477 [Gymnopilus junonius]|uniref:Uncharacterized protein n=1 Tax=Gymnopilus junonius TaxID=109634 RepID=A0A9P5THY5_GYMJU|nr:hypothetical protein CPB84DRAFT_197477 [Gymnopilus junonius]
MLKKYVVTVQYSTYACLSFKSIPARLSSGCYWPWRFRPQVLAKVVVQCRTHRKLEVHSIHPLSMLWTSRVAGTRYKEPRCASNPSRLPSISSNLRRFVFSISNPPMTKSCRPHNNNPHHPLFLLYGIITTAPSSFSHRHLGSCLSPPPPVP